MGELIAPLAERQRDPVDDARMERIAARLEAADYQRPTSRGAPLRLAIGAGAVAAICVAVYGVAVLWSSGSGDDVDEGLSLDGPLTLAGGRAFGTLESSASQTPEQRRYELSDGSMIELGRETRLRALENRSSAVVIALERGQATFDINSAGERRWVIDAGVARVTVLGTRFRVVRTTNDVTVDVERGVVQVDNRELYGGRRLIAGESLTVRSGDSSEESEVATSPQVVSDACGGDAGAFAGDALHRGERSRSRSWESLARQGEFNEAFGLLGAEGLEREVRRAPSVDELYLLADVARRSGHPADAVAPLERIIAGFPTDRRAAVAAFTLGRIQLNTLGEPGRARWAFERAIELGVPPALTEDSLALLVEARARSGDSLGARTAARDYFRRFPNGRLSATVRSWTEIGER